MESGVVLPLSLGHAWDNLRLDLGACRPTARPPGDRKLAATLSLSGYAAKVVSNAVERERA